MEHRPLEYYLEGYLQGRLTPAEEEILSGMLMDPAFEEEFMRLAEKKLDYWDQNRQEFPEGTERVKQAVLSRLQGNHALSGRGNRVLRIPAWLKYAAAVVLVAGIGSYLWMKRLTPDNNRQMAGSLPNIDILPGSEKATLTLSDGRKFGLDTVPNGVLAQQGGATVKKRDSGQISYDLESLPAGHAMVNLLQTPRGGQYKLILSDGSKVWLNAASSISFPTAFPASERRVKVSGEVYFEVMGNKARPFIVDVEGKTSVEVLGTHFNINSYPEEQSIKTTLLEGLVRVGAPVTPDRSRSFVILKPHQQAVIQREPGVTPSSPKTADAGLGMIKVTSHVDVDKVVSWKNGLFDFNGADLTAVLNQLKRWYDVDVRYEGNIKPRIFRGRMTRDLNLSQILRVLEAVQVKCRIENRTLIVSE